MTSFEAIHQRSIVIDATCPLATLENHLEHYRRGGVTAIAATVGYGTPGIGNIQFTMKTLATWFKRFEENQDRLMLITSAEDIISAKKENKLGIIFHFQGSLPLEDDLNIIGVYHRLGLRICQLCYNTKDLVGCGCAEKEDTGLTEFGVKAVHEMNRLGIVVDCAHTGIKTTLDTIEASQSPVIISHGNARAVCQSKRNLGDDVIKAIASNGGVIGINGFPRFVCETGIPDLDDYINHVDYLVNLVGVDHVCIGMDYFEYQAGVVDDPTAKVVYDYLLESGAWSAEDYPPPPWNYPKGIELPDKMANLTRGLLERGYDEDGAAKILGGNILNVFREVWKY